MKKTIFACGLVAVLSLSATTMATAQEFSGVTYAAFREGQDPRIGVFPTITEVREDFSLLKTVTTRIRTYVAVEGGVSYAQLAQEYGMSAILGAWVQGQDSIDTRELNAVIAQAQQLKNVQKIIIGNETVLRGELTPAQIGAYLQSVKSHTSIPVSTAEPWGVWRENPQLANNADYIAAHVLPYWENVSIDNAVDYVVERVRILEKLFPGKPVLVAETGWPSAGETRGNSVASLANHQRFIREFKARATAENIDYLIIEGFDQPWKASKEGEVGAHWGIFDKHRTRKASGD